MQIDSKAVITGLIVLILAICGNYVGNTLSCHTQRILQGNMFAKHCIIILSLFVAIDSLYTARNEKKNERRQNPLDTLGMTTILYIVFLVLTRMTREFTIFVFVLTVMLYFIDLFNDYYAGDNIHIKKLKNVIFVLLCVSVVVGFVLYVRKKMKQKANFNIKSFILGIPACENKQIVNS